MPGTLVFDYPSISAVTDFLTAQMAKNTANNVVGEEVEDAAGDVVDFVERPWGSSALTVADAPQRAAVAVISMAVRPLMADPTQSLPAGMIVDKIQSVPLARWDLDGVESLLKDPFTLSAQVRKTQVLKIADFRIYVF